MIFVESSRDACLSFDECYEICFRQNCTFSFALFVHFHLTFTCKFIEPYVDSDDYNKLRSKIYKKTRYYAVYQNKYFDKMKEVLDVIFKGIREPRVCYCQKRLKDLKKQFISNKKDTECIWCSGNWDSQNKCCKLKYISADNNYTEFSEYSALCKKEDSNMYAEKMLSAEDRLTWLKFVYNKFIIS